jgi:hypothetical protein
MACGADNEKDCDFCKKCGQKLNYNENSAETIELIDSEKNNGNDRKSIKENKRKYIWLICAILVFLVFVIITIIVMKKPKVKSISAKYEGDTVAGVELDSHNNGFVVTATYEDGTKEEISKWKIEDSKVLEEDSSAKVTITYKDCTTNVSVNCSSSAVTSIEASYDGDTEAGVVIDNNSNITVREKHKNGKITDAENAWNIENPVTLEADETAKVKVECGEFETELSMDCTTRTLTSIEASYDGDTEEGTVLDASNKGIHVKAVYKNGKKETVTDYKIKDSATLSAGKTSTVVVEYENLTCDLSVECTTIDPEIFKAECKSIAYDDLARNPESYKGEKVVFTGKVVQTMEQSGVGVLRVNVTKTRFGYDDTVYVLYTVDSSNRILEDDIVTLYGYSMGLYTYETVLGASVTIPEILVSYVERN